MDSELINGAPSSPAAPNCRDLSRKKRRSAKLKQCKLDARREQWLSQCPVKNKVCKEDIHGKSRQTCGGVTRSMENFEMTKRDEQCGGVTRSLENFEVRRRDEESGGRSIQHESDSESPSNSPTSILLGAKDCGTNFSTSSSSSSSSRSSSGGCCSASISEEDEGGDDDTLDNWEAIADALAADEKQESDETQCQGLASEAEPISQSGEMKSGAVLDVGNSKQECTRLIPRVIGNSRAWSPDDAFRPQSLPNLSKQLSFPVTDCHFSQGGVPCSSPSSCPICFEDLDLTDSSFLPCLCGFRLCLFCHKRILEDDGRCPACRKPYEQDHLEAEPNIRGGSLTFRLARSCSMIARS